MPDTPRTRFVILERDHPFPHLDLLIQESDVLKAWRLLDAFAPDRWLAAEAIPDHRLMYLDYEGPVSGNRGYVTRLTAGAFERVTEATGGELTFEVFDCDLATKATCREYGSAKPYWRFS